LLEISTDKVDTEVPSPTAGTVLEITAAEDSTVEVGAQLAVVGSGSPTAAPSAPQQPPQQEQPPAPAAAPPQPEPAPQPDSPQRSAPPQQAQPQSAEPQSAPPPPAPAAPASSADGAGTPYVTPLVRKLASENNIYLTSLTGS